MTLVNAAPSLDADIDRYLQRENVGPLSGDVHHWAGTLGTRVDLTLTCLNAAAAPAVSAA